ncbi:unnamed protein product, partial [marine sediment metagenome]
TFDNPHLPAEVLASLRANFEGTRRGLQELYGEILEDSDRFLWSLDTIAKNRVRNMPELVRIVVSIDPAVTAHAGSDETGIVVAGVDADGEGYILEDATMKGAPHEWASRAIQLYKVHSADCIVAEVNNGGDLVESVLRGVDRNIAYKCVRATRGKVLRAEPIAALYEKDRVHHVGIFDKLENQMCGWQPGQPSPDRIDALVWALTDLMLDPTPVVGPLSAYI